MIMVNQIWVPEENQLVKWNRKLFRIISVNMGGKCDLKEFTTSRRFTKRIKDVDINELQPVSKTL